MKHHALLLSVAPFALLAAPAMARAAAPGQQAQPADSTKQTDAQTKAGIQQDTAEVPDRSPVQA